MKDLEVIQENMDLLTEPKHASVGWPKNRTIHGTTPTFHQFDSEV